MAVKDWLRALRWILPTSLGLALGLALLDRSDKWWMGILAYGVLLLVVLSLLWAGWRAGGTGRFLGIWLLLSFGLRLLIGVALTYLMPETGYEAPVYMAGYSYIDAYNRDLEAWELAASDQSLTIVLSRDYVSVDQYRGLLTLSALVYRCLSPDAHRPWLIIILSAGAYALGCAFLWRATRETWSEGLARTATWIYALYPETLLLGSSQMREPYLIAFVAVAWWGVVAWQSKRKRSAWVWVGVGLMGLLTFSPGVALVSVVVLTGWLWLERQKRGVSWKILLTAGAIFLAALVLFSIAISRSDSLTSTSLLGKILQWFRYSAAWDIYQLARSSPRIEPLFEELPKSLHLPFVIVYGLLQPVLPAALVEPAPWLVQSISILRAVGWYGMLPLLGYGLAAAIRTPGGQRKSLWLWLGLAIVIWMVISAIRAGGDQWDNPRYRVIFLPWQVLLAGYAVVFRRERKDPLLWRFLAVEGVFLVFFTEWYISRYTGGLIGRLQFWDMVAWITGLGFLILVGGWLWDWKRSRVKSG